MQRLILALLLGTSALVGCKKDPIENLSGEESRVYITNRDNNATFTAYKTVTISDSVLVIDDGRVSAQPSTGWDAQFIQDVRNAFATRGYTLVPRSQSPDLAVTVSRLYNTTTNVVDYSSYYSGYGGYYDPYYYGYGGYDYYFPSYYGIYQSTEAAVSVDLLDLKNASTTHQIRGVWQGLIRGSGIFNAANTGSQVKALFDQSPYLTVTR